jgi:hypothetical protein
MTFDDKRAFIESKMNAVAASVSDFLEGKSDAELGELAEALNTRLVTPQELSVHALQTLCATTIIRELQRRFEVEELEEL